MSNRFFIRRVTPEDIDLVRRMADEVFPATYAAILTPEQLDYMMGWMYAPQTLLRELDEGFAWFVAYAAPDAECVVDERQQESATVPCGYLSVQREGEELFHLQKIYVLPSFQGTGAGAFLFREAVRYVRSQCAGRCRMELNVNRHNPALGFYERMGMRRLREGDFPIGNGYYMNDYIMGIDIE